MQESYKSFIKQKIWIFIMILLVIRMVSVCITGYDSHYMIDENEKYYNEYLKKYEGKITDAKQKQIEKEYKKVSSTLQLPCPSFLRGGFLFLSFSFIIES